ncbi:MAG: LuxR C-terminal-related transcriptional regulator [Gammaproteobacteria bacterium]|nr:LuxR C-terminal-related transcriptional regulator [Gammaproteobacteria bacterium]MBU1980446.1 LuxR C-terminal-related transcriptional regulator [Gammaproteobacteria bacterium]
MNIYNNNDMVLKEKKHLTLEGEDQDHLVSIINSSLRVANMHHFFSWSQGAIQFLLPHEILVCGVAMEAGLPMRFMRFSSSRYFDETRFSEVCEPGEGLLPRMILHSNKTGHACMLGTGAPQRYFDEALLPLLERSELRSAAADGQRGLNGQLKSYFCFSRVEIPLGARVEYLLQLLVPFLHTTLSRVISNEEPDIGTDGVQNVPSVTAREVQVLHHIKLGKTNQQIAEELALSPLTVKNHVQRILRKLNASNRGHAVALAINFGVLKAQ